MSIKSQDHNPNTSVLAAKLRLLLLHYDESLCQEVYSELLKRPVNCGLLENIPIILLQTSLNCFTILVIHVLKFKSLLRENILKETGHHSADLDYMGLFSTLMQLLRKRY